MSVKYSESTEQLWVEEFSWRDPTKRPEEGRRGLEKNQQLVNIYKANNSCVIYQYYYPHSSSKETACREHSHLAHSLRTS